MTSLSETSFAFFRRSFSNALSAPDSGDEQAAPSVALPEEMRENRFRGMPTKRRYFAQATSTVLPTPGT